MAKEIKNQKLNDENLKEVPGGQTIGEWLRQHMNQPGPVGNQNLVKQGQSNSGNPQEFWQQVWCPLCNAPFDANIMLDQVHCPNPNHPPITIKG